MEFLIFSLLDQNYVSKMFFCILMSGVGEGQKSAKKHHWHQRISGILIQVENFLI